MRYSPSELKWLFVWLLAADVIFTFIDQIEPYFLPIMLKAHGASNREIAIIASSIGPLMQFLITPVLSYRSDRLRTPRGRRIPYLLWATPYVSVFLAITPFAPDIAGLLGGTAAESWLARWSVSPLVLTFGVLVVGFRFFEQIVALMFFCLFRDVVPQTHMGRFLALFRFFGAMSTFVITYWFLGYAETHAKIVFIGVAVLNLVGFLLLCRFVKEGEYPPPKDDLPPEVGESRLRALVKAARNFVSQSYREPVYIWTHLTRLFIYAAFPIRGFVVFFPQKDLGLGTDAAGKLMSWSSIVWLAFAWPVGVLMDRVGPLRVLGWGLAGLIASHLASFVLATGAVSFMVLTTVGGVFFWVVMLAQLAMAQHLYHRDRYGQLSTAGMMVQAVIIAFIISPASGWVFDLLDGFSEVLALPWGDLPITQYRFSFLLLALAYLMSLGCLWLLIKHWKRHGGGSPGGYQAPH